MERAKKMVLIPTEQFERIQRDGLKPAESPPHIAAAIPPTAPTAAPTSLHSTQTAGDNLTRLDNEMRKILDSTTYGNDHDRLKDYLRVLQRYLFFVEEKRKPVSFTEEKKEEKQYNVLQDELIVKSVPKLYQTKAQLLLNHLKSNKDRFSWNENGIVSIDGEKIKSSNIVDLINDAVRYRKNTKAVAREPFAILLRNINTPQEFVGNSKLWELGSATPSRKRLYNRKNYNDGDDGDDGDEDDNDNTPHFLDSFDNTPLFINKSDPSFLSETVRGSSSISPNKSSGKKKKNKNSRTSTPMPKKWLNV